MTRKKKHEDNGNGAVDMPPDGSEGEAGATTATAEPPAPAKKDESDFVEPKKSEIIARHFELIRDLTTTTALLSEWERTSGSEEFCRRVDVVERALAEATEELVTCEPKELSRHQGYVRAGRELLATFRGEDTLRQKRDEAAAALKTFEQEHPLLLGKPATEEAPKS